MLEPAILSVISFLLVMLMVYLWASKRNLLKNKTLTPHEYLWKLKCIPGKSEYEIFHLAAEDKGWPKYQADGEKGQIEKACADLKLVCASGYCENYNIKKRKGVYLP